jgi:hypothetical protein
MLPCLPSIQFLTSPTIPAVGTRRTMPSPLFVCSDLPASAASHARHSQALLRVAELVAKVTYNASGHSAPFDFHCGWGLPHAVREFARALTDREFDAAAIKFLLHESFPKQRNA